VRCRIPCDLVAAGTSVSAEVRDISAGGLGVLAEAPDLEQGDPVTLLLRPPGARPFEISALVWHVRAVRRGTGGKVVRSWGLVLGDASPEFAELVENLKGGSRAARPLRTEPEVPAPMSARETTPPATRPAAASPAAPRAATPSPAVAPPPAPPTLRQFAIRMRRIGGPRTCRIVACGTTESEAIEAALAEVGEGWTAIDGHALA
jgi:hypothetical protein